MKIIAYKKYIDESITRTLLMPADAEDKFIGTELATLSDGLTYASIPATSILPVQPTEIAASVATVTLTSAQIAEIKQKSPHVRLINERVRDKIRAQYQLHDELKLARIAIGALQKSFTPTAAETQSIADYQTAVELARAWGQTEKAKLGL